MSIESVAPSSAGSLHLYEVGTVKPVVVGDGQVRTGVSVDGGMSDNPRPALIEADYSATLANRSSEAPPVVVRVVGKHCESGDIVVLDEWLPGDVRPGDLIAVPGTGAYCRALSSQYNPRRARRRRGRGRSGTGHRASRRSTTSRALTSTSREVRVPRSQFTHVRLVIGAAAGRPARLWSRRILGRPSPRREHSGDPPPGSGPLELVGIAVRRLGRDRSDVPVDPSLFTTDAAALVSRADIVVEVIEASSRRATCRCRRVMASGASVVSANKALLAEDGLTLWYAARTDTASTSITRRTRRRGYPDSATDP